MVSFNCDNCGDVVKKPKLDQHRSRCGGSFTCLDCSTTFWTPAEYKGHTACISEEQKYQKSVYKPKKGKQSESSKPGTPSGDVNGKSEPTPASTTLAPTSPAPALATNGEPDSEKKKGKKRKADSGEAGQSAAEADGKIEVNVTSTANDQGDGDEGRRSEKKAKKDKKKKDKAAKAADENEGTPIEGVMTPSETDTPKDGKKKKDKKDKKDKKKDKGTPGSKVDDDGDDGARTARSVSTLASPSALRCALSTVLSDAPSSPITLASLPTTLASHLLSSPSVSLDRVEGGEDKAETQRRLAEYVAGRVALREGKSKEGKEGAVRVVLSVLE